VNPLYGLQIVEDANVPTDYLYIMGSRLIMSPNRTGWSMSYLWRVRFCSSIRWESDHADQGSETDA
jgi:hypothetical protein